MKIINLIFIIVFNSAPCFPFLGTQNVSSQNIGINTFFASPKTSAILDIDDVGANDKGILIPRVALSDVNTFTPITGQNVESLIIYDSSGTAVNGNGKGFYYWNGSKWLFLTAPANGPGNNGQVLTCMGDGISPQWQSISGGNQFAIGVFSPPADTGDLSVNVGFQPSFLKIYCTRVATPQIDNTSISVSYGIATSPTNQFCSISYMRAGGSDGGNWVNNPGIIARAAYNGSGWTWEMATLKSIEATGFTLNYTSVTGNGECIYEAYK